jgi:hypothetical protein
MTTLTHTPATKGQIRQITRVGSDAIEQVLDELGLSKDSAQRVHASGDEFATAMREAAKTSLLNLSTTDKYKDEEVDSKYGYLSGYEKPKGITEQTNRLRELIPGIGYADEKIAEGELPKGTEGWFAIPKWQSVAPTYAEAVPKVFDLIKKTCDGKFYNCRDGQIVNERLRQTAKTEAMFQKLGDEQNDHNILVVPAQFGLRHRGRSVRRAREVMNANECGLGAFAIGIMLLTHPERLSHYDDLWIDCAGDEFDDPDSEASFAHAPYFFFDDGKVKFGAGGVAYAGDGCGSVSGFVPQS